MLFRQPVVRKLFTSSLMLVCLLLAACGGSPQATSSSGNQPVTLTWFMWSASTAEVTDWQHDASLVTQKYPWIHVKFETADWNDYWTKLQSEAASGTLPDIISLQSGRTAGFANSFLPLDSYVKNSNFDLSSFDPSIIKALSAQNGLRALPYDFGPQVVFYNKTLFDKYHVAYPPANWTYAQFLQTAQQLTHANDYGFIATPYPDYWLPFALSTGANYLNASGQLNLNNPQLASAFQNYAKLVYQYHVSPTVSVPQATNTPALWQAGNIGMIADGPWDLINYKENAKFQFGITTIPSMSQGSVSIVAGSGFGISANSQHADDAWKAISVLTSSGAEQYLSTQGRAFAARTAQQQYWYQNAVPGAQDTLNAALKNAAPELTTSNWNEVATLLTQYGVNVLTGQETAAKALSDIQSQAQSS